MFDITGITTPISTFATAKNAVGYTKVEVMYENGSIRKFEIEPGFDESDIKGLYQVGKIGMSGNGEYSKVKAVKISK